MNRKLVYTLILIVISGAAFGQEIKYRFSANMGSFNSEVGTAEIEHPLVGVLSNPASTDFVSNYKVGYEAEIIVPFSDYFETGLEVEFSNYSGSNEIPPYYNFYFAPDNPSVIHTTEPLFYESSTMGILLNGRINLIPKGKFNPFVKVFGGVAFVGSNFSYKDRNFIVENELPDVLYAVGTEHSDDPKKTALYYGAGAGFNFKISESIAFTVDGGAAFIGSDLINGVPNYNYINNDGQETLEPASNLSMLTQFSFGLVFYSKKDIGLFGKNDGGTNKGVKRTGRTTKYRPFYRQK